ncbi:hypothetical protein OUZ56_006032 [Daphnia magna]|uniref:Uncharacterized protein n=1 Tax=Daphnia magna TaxID=35525 RepID=A0ABQ9YUF7_9CRUS|nr:hypothetical protein OUZ56_006032 [Daphnia magna]
MPILRGMGLWTMVQKNFTERCTVGHLHVALLDQSPARRIESIKIPDVAAPEAAAPLVEWAENIAMSIPASDKYSFIHLATVLPDTNPTGCI